MEQSEEVIEKIFGEVFWEYMSKEGIVELSEEVIAQIIETVFVEYISTTTVMSREEARRVFYTCKINEAAKEVDIVRAMRLFGHGE